MSTAVFGGAERFACEMRSAIDDQDFTDVTFLVGEKKEKICAHRIILAARCEVFRAMFAEQRSQAHKKKTMNGGVVEYAPLALPDVSPAVFHTVLEYIYTNSCRLTADTVVDVMAPAVEYGLDGLAECCGQFISERLSVDTACAAIQAAVTYDRANLREQVMQFIENNTAEVLKSSGMAELSAETFFHILQSNNLRATEEELLEAVEKWGAINSAVGHQSLASVVQPVIRGIRFPLLKPETLKRIEQSNITAEIVPTKLLAKAWKYHATREAEANDMDYVARAGSQQL